MHAVAFSPDGKYFALSTATHGAIWEAATGKRIISLRPFSAAYIDSKNVLYADLPKYGEQKRAQIVFDINRMKGSPSPASLTDNEHQFVGVVVKVIPLGKTPQDDQVEYEVRSISDNHVLWDRRYENGAPYHAGSLYDEYITLWWPLKSPGAKHELATQPQLNALASSVKNRNDGVLVELLNKQTGQLAHSAIVEEKAFKNVEDSRFMFGFGDTLLVTGELNNTVVYRLSDNTRLTELFGHFVGYNVQDNLFAIVNRRKELIIYDGATGSERFRFQLASPVRIVHFLPESKEVMVITADQQLHYYSLAAPQSLAPSLAPTHPPTQ
jgi:hypothetical protein